MSGARAARQLFMVCLVLVAVIGMVARAQPASPTPAETSRKGRAVYTNYCAGCHLASGAGTPPAIPPLTDSGRMRDVRHVVRTIRQGRGSMPAFRQLDAAEIQAVTAYV